MLTLKQRKLACKSVYFIISTKEKHNLQAETKSGSYKT